jgi:hypothetical protein
MTTVELRYPQASVPRVRAKRCGRLLLALVALALGCSVAAHGSADALVAVDIYDRTDGTPLELHWKDGERYVVGTPGHEYAIRIRNRTGQRILAVTSVDGVNVLSGDTASPQQSGYVINAGASSEIQGWRTSLERTSAFYFTDLGDSYAARTGRPRNVGVIGVAVFREMQEVQRFDLYRFVPPAADQAARSDARPVPAPAEPAAAGAIRENAARAATGEAQAPAAKLGTGYGRDERSPVQLVPFERATPTPVEIVSIRYDRRENLVALGVLPPPRYAEHSPEPFPAMRFVPSPR